MLNGRLDKKIREFSVQYTEFEATERYFDNV